MLITNEIIHVIRPRTPHPPQFMLVKSELLINKYFAMYYWNGAKLGWERGVYIGLWDKGVV